MSDQERREIQEITDGLTDLFMGKNKHLTVVVALSIAATTAHMIGMSKLEIQKILIRCYDKRIAEDHQNENPQPPAGGKPE